MDRRFDIQPFPRGEIVGRFGHDGGGPNSLLWVVFALLLVLLLLVIVSLAVDAYYRSQPGARLQPATGSLAVLDNRYARGELDRDAYLQARSDLGGEEAPTLVAPPPPEPAAEEPPKTTS